MVYIGHVGVDSNGVTTGGSGGDTKSIFKRPFYNKQWTHLYRFPKDKANKIAESMLEICNNEYIDYKENDTLSLYNQGYIKKWNFDKIKEPCGANTITLFIVLLRSIGFIQGNPEVVKFKDLDWLLARAGAEKLTFIDKELLKKGDFLFSDSHAVVVLSDGDKIDNRTGKQIFLDSATVNRYYLDKGIAAAALRASIPVYSGPGLHYTIYKIAPRGAELTVLEILPDDWVKITYPFVQSGYGYIYNENNNFLKLDDSFFPKEEPKMEAIITVNYPVYIKGSRINVRKDPVPGAAIIGTLTRDKYYIVQECGEFGLLSSGLGWVKLNCVTKEVNNGAKDMELSND